MKFSTLLLNLILGFTRLSYAGFTEDLNNASNSEETTKILVSIFQNFVYEENSAPYTPDLEKIIVAQLNSDSVGLKSVSYSILFIKAEKDLRTKLFCRGLTDESHEIRKLVLRSIDSKDMADKKVKEGVVRILSASNKSKEISIALDVCRFLNDPSITAVVSDLLDHSSPQIRRKALEICVARDDFKAGEHLDKLRSSLEKEKCLLQMNEMMNELNKTKMILPNKQEKESIANLKSLIKTSR